MSLAISLIVPDGIVMAADRLWLNFMQDAQNAIKSFRLRI
jgi:hypothetical protein